MRAFDEDLWPKIRPHAWKWQTGRVDVVGAIVHCTRSGIAGRTSLQELNSTRWWFIDEDNAVRDSAGNKWYGGMSNDLVGDGKLVRCVPVEYVPRFSAGIHDFRAVSIEICQGVRGEAIDARDIAVAAERLRDLSREFGFPLTRIAFVDGNNIGWPGLVGHEDTAQGRQQGKSDPGPGVWEALLAELEVKGDEVTREEYEALLKRVERVEVATAQCAEQVFGTPGLPENGRVTEAYVSDGDGLWTSARIVNAIKDGSIPTDGVYTLRRVAPKG